MPQVLELELETFRANLGAWLGDPTKQGRFVLIHDADVIGFYDRREDALDIGYARFEGAFLVKQVIEKEEPKYFSRNLVPCR